MQLAAIEDARRRMVQDRGSIDTKSLDRFPDLTQARTSTLTKAVIDATGAVHAFADLPQDPHSSRAEMHRAIAGRLGQFAPLNVVVKRGELASAQPEPVVL